MSANRRWLTPRDERGAVRLIGLAVGLLLLALGSVAAPTVDAATPREGTVGPPPDPATVTWVGHHYAAAAIADPAAGGAGCPPEADPQDLVCDHFFLTVNVTPGYWDTHTGGVRVSIGWASADDDFDMYIYKSGAVIERSGGSTNTEEVFLQEPSGTYEVRVVPFLVTDEGADGVAAFESADGGDPPNPPRDTGGLVFGPATVIDAQRTEGEPLNFIDPGTAAYWESGPFGTTTQQSFVHRSVDGGDQFNIVSPIELRPNQPPGGGDTDIVVDDQGVAYFTDLEALVNLDCSVSNDNGNTWRKNLNCVPTAGVDRQWFALDNGTTGAASDNTVFLGVREVARGIHVYSTPGSTGPLDPVGGFLYTDSSADAPLPIAGDTTCGQLRFDRVKRNLYYPCEDGSHVRMTIGHVDPGQRTGIVYRNVNLPASPGGSVGDIFPGVATDQAGNVYGVWVDSIDHNVYYSFSTDQGTTWSAPIQVNGNEANSNVFPWAQGGAAGKLVVGWYGSPSNLDSDAMTSWFNDRQGATQFDWFGYVSVVSSAATSTPTFAQQRFTKTPMNYGQICNGGLGCSLSGGDRTMADFFGFVLDPTDGAIRIVYNDTTSQHHGAHLFEMRQLGGPSALGGTVNRPVPSNPMADRAGDAQSPHYSAVGAGANLPQYDLTSVKLSKPDGATLRVQMTLDSLASLLPPPGEAAGVWLSRFQALSVGEGGEEAYRIFYVGAESIGGGPMTFFAGSGDAASEEGVPGDGCVTRNPEECKIVLYPSEVAATGSVSGKTITIDVPIEGGFGTGRPIKGDTLHNVTALTFGRTSGDDLYTDVDGTRGFDFSLLDPVADLSVAKTDDPDPVHVGQQLTYTVTVENRGPLAASGVALQDQLPKGAGFGSVRTSQGTCTFKPQKRLVTCSLGAVAAGGTATVTITVKPTQKGTISNTATVSATAPPDPNTTNNKDTETTTVRP